MISRDEALANAVQAIDDGLPSRAAAYIALAGELRQQPEPPGARLTLHDIEAKMCAHNKISLHDRRAATSWWLHACDHSVCDPS